MSGRWGAGRAFFGKNRTVEVPCTVEIERNADSFYANAIPEGVQLRPGDRVLVHGAPNHVAFGDHVVFQTRATVIRANALERWWTEWVAIFELTELYHCGFEPKEAVAWNR